MLNQWKGNYLQVWDGRKEHIEVHREFLRQLNFTFFQTHTMYNIEETSL
jgi:hypothetical protein